MIATPSTLRIGVHHDLKRACVPVIDIFLVLLNDFAPLLYNVTQLVGDNYVSVHA